jgi:hypothetical protein
MRSDSHIARSKKKLLEYEARCDSKGAEIPALKETFETVMTSIGNGLDHIDKYTRILTKNPVYLAAIVLDPKWKWDYVQSMARREHPDHYEDWLDTAKASVKTLLETQYKGEDAGEIVSLSGTGPANNDYLYALMFDSHQAPPAPSQAASPEVP